MNDARVYETEVRFYQELAPFTNLPIPVCYFSAIDSSTGNSLLLLEDLGKRYRKIDFSPNIVQEAEIVVTHFAQFHAQWWKNPNLKSISYLSPHSSKADHWQIEFQKWWRDLPSKLDILIPEYQLPQKFYELGKQFGPNLARLFIQLSSDPMTLIHKDTHGNNILFSIDGTSMKVIDWQMVGYGLGVGDITFFLVSSIPTEIRQQQEKRLLRLYFESLIANGVSDYSFEQCQQDYERSYFKNLYTVGILVGLLDTSSEQGKTLLRALIPRVAAFCDEHDVQRYVTNI